MIRAVIFDLDGTLLQTEKLKARSYAQAAVELCPRDLTEAQVIEAFKDVVGLSRKDVAEKLIERFGLEDGAAARMTEFGVSTPWQTFIQVRLGHYSALLNDPDTLRNNQWPYNVGLLEKARAMGCTTALATMSHCEQVNRIMNVLGWQGHFDFVATRDDVTNGKPDPEIYEMVLAELGVVPADALVIEDSPAGVRAGVAAGTHVIAVSTPFTRDQLHALDVIAPEWIVDDPARLLDVVQAKFDAVGVHSGG